ncbi:MAG: hypothetical protein JO171_17640 [Paludibacterium sp.]|uniref:hypothetical protein n=1 Tax=Paludibacterium sp. TaxID=1917523 RepID=UPI0025D9DF59|nr:hypothetical protein [Paludibacterium sp.]MBV8048977.1 hypothetical protein [Paludibacterium sp.]MBV8646579.1 hypothetical protein [Paludibacterium sp.]
MYRLLRLTFLLIVFALLPLQAWAAGAMPPSGAAAGQAVSASMAAAHCQPAQHAQHSPRDTAAGHHHTVCCQAPLFGLSGSAAHLVPMTPPQASWHDAHYTSFDPEALSPPPRA